MAGRILNKAQLAQELGRTEKVIGEWLKKGIPHAKNGGRYEFTIAEVVRWREDYVRNTHANGRPTGKVESDKEKRARARDDAALRESEARAEKLEMENAVRRNELAPIPEMQTVWEALVMKCRAKLLALPTKFAQEFAMEDRPAVIKEIAEEAVHEALNELAGGSNAGTDSGGEGGT